MKKLFFFFIFFAPLVFSMDENRREFEHELNAYPYSFEKLISATEQLFSHGNDTYDFKNDVANTLSCMLKFKSFDDILNNASWVNVFFEFYIGHLVDHELLEYTSLDGVNIVLLNHGQKRMLMERIAYQIEHLLVEIE